MMGLSPCWLLIFIFFLKGCNTSTSPELPYCHDEESSALLQFKESLTINTSVSLSEGAHPKVLSWKSAQGGNNISCCTWDGVECDKQTGHVIGLNLRGSCLYGSINSNNSLFRLVHLQMLDLSDNHFNYSQIPSSIRNFQRLTYIDLSASMFSGRVPSEFSQLVKLTFLKLSYNTESPSSVAPLLTLDESNFRSLVRNLTNLQQLRLRFVNISSPVPDSIANLSFLAYLDLHRCELLGKFPVAIFHLQYLTGVYLRDNQDLIGHLPEFNQSSRLTELELQNTNFSGNFPSSIGKIASLRTLDVAKCSFSPGLIPSSLGNLRELTYLDLSGQFGGQIPDSFANLTELYGLGIASSGLTGPIPSWLGNFSKLAYLDFGHNRLNSSIPTSFSNLTNLQWLYLQSNNLSGIVEFQIFQKLPYLRQLQLGDNHLEFVSESTAMNASTVPQFSLLNLHSCKIREFPYFLRYQNFLRQLSLRGNKIQGQVPNWLWNMSIGSLFQLDISENFLSGQLPIFIPWVNLRILSLGSNMFHGPLPIPASSTLVYETNDNNFTGKVSPVICNMSSLLALDLSNNNLFGMIPQCFGNFSDQLTVLLLGNNSFHGTLPQTYTNCSIRMLDVSRNQLQGQLPRSLANCLMLETLILSNNSFTDVFPFWLGILPELKLLAMRYNGFQGMIGKPESSQRFQKLRILDISHNNFTGEFVAEYILSNNTMRSNSPVNWSTYMEVNISYPTDRGVYTGLHSDLVMSHMTYRSSITVMSKGVDKEYVKIPEAIALIDISCNRFEGKIDEWIQNLKGLVSLNVSHNLLTGGIPSSLGNLKNLESLDLSNNMLSGEIPQQLAQLTFLGEFDVSHNNLTGLIPQGQQFNIFNITSYEGNTGLCGDRLPKKCGNSNTPPFETVDNMSGIEFDWKFVLAGYVSGLVVGVVLADLAITRRPQLFLEIVGTLIRLKQRITSWKRFERYIRGVYVILTGVVLYCVMFLVLYFTMLYVILPRF